MVPVPGRIGPGLISTGSPRSAGIADALALCRVSPYWGGPSRNAAQFMQQCRTS